MTLRQRLVALVAVAILPAVAALGYFIAAFHQERERDVHDQARRMSQLVALEIGRIVTGSQGILETLAFAPSVRALGDGCPDFLDEVDERLPQVAGFAIAEIGGQVRCTTGAFDGISDLSAQQWFAAALRNGALEVGNFTPGTETHGPFLPLAMPITGQEQARVFVTGIDLAWLGARLHERNLAPGSVIAIADRTGVLIAREPDPQEYVGRPINPDFMPLVTAAYAGSAEMRGRDGTWRIVGYQPPAATGLGLYVGVGYSTELAFAPIYASTWRSLAIAGAGAVAAFVLAWSLGDRLFRQPIRQILVTVASWRAGDETARTGITEDASELTALAASIDEYMDNLAAVRAERQSEERRRALLLREMNHRIKNILAAVQAISNQTFKDRASPESLHAFGSRLAAMAAAHDLLVSESWESADLHKTLAAALLPWRSSPNGWSAAAHDLLVSESWESADLHKTLAAALQPFGLDRQGRFVLDGPPVQITAKAALALSMALHELCTNASKYGALSIPGGHVEISWGVERAGSGARFRLTWAERGGPEVTPPSRRGFSSRLIQSALASELSASNELLFNEDGVIFELDADAAMIVIGAGTEPAS